MLLYGLAKSELKVLVRLWEKQGLNPGDAATLKAEAGAGSGSGRLTRSPTAKLAIPEGSREGLPKYLRDAWMSCFLCGRYQIVQERRPGSLPGWRRGGGWRRLLFA